MPAQPERPQTDQVVGPAAPLERLVEGGVVEQRVLVVHLLAAHAVGEDGVLGDRLAEIDLERADALLDQAQDLLDVPLAAGRAAEVDDAAAVRRAARDGRRVEVDGPSSLCHERAVLQAVREHLALLRDPRLEPEADPDPLLAQAGQVAGRVREPRLVPDQVGVHPLAQPGRVQVDHVDRHPLLAGLRGRSPRPRPSCGSVHFDCQNPNDQRGGTGGRPVSAGVAGQDVRDPRAAR